MSRRFGFGLVWLVVTLLIAGGAAAFAYHLGTMATVTAASNGAYLVHPYAYGFFPFFAFFGLFPLFLFVLFILLLARLFSPRRWRRGGWYGPGGGPQDPHGHGPRHWQGGLPPAFEEWHRRAHGETPPETAAPAKPGDEPPQRA